MFIFTYMNICIYTHLALCLLRVAKRFSGLAMEPDLCLTRVPIRARPLRAQGAHKGSAHISAKGSRKGLAHKGPRGPTRARLTRA